MSNTRKPTGKTVGDPRGVIKVRVGGRQRTLRFDANAIIEAQEATGCASIEVALERISELDMRITRALLWAGLLHADPDLDIREVGSWLGSGPGMTTFAEVLRPIVEAVNAAIGSSGDTGEDDDRPTKGGSGTGTRSSTPPSELD